ncbi:hypothetical protein [Afifella sp. YEN Y35]|uniref:hypothetical protein n=1 Tax=Afifella sp. YEN Y35 TaxID=3388337 RepID=UPI0039E09E57
MTTKARDHRFPLHKLGATRAFPQIFDSIDGSSMRVRKYCYQDDSEYSNNQPYEKPAEPISAFTACDSCCDRSADYPGDKNDHGLLHSKVE